MLGEEYGQKYTGTRAGGRLNNVTLIRGRSSIISKQVATTLNKSLASHIFLILRIQNSAVGWDGGVTIL